MALEKNEWWAVLGGSDLAVGGRGSPKQACGWVLDGMGVEVGGRKRVGAGVGASGAALASCWLWPVAVG